MCLSSGNYEPYSMYLLFSNNNNLWHDRQLISYLIRGQSIEFPSP